MSAFAPEVEVAVARTREEVANLHAELVRNGLSVSTGGNVSGRVFGADAFVIKPSGVSCDDPSPENMIVCDLDGVIVANAPGNEREPSSDTAAHAYVYRNMSAVGGVVRTPSPYATAWAALGEATPGRDRRTPPPLPERLRTGRPEVNGVNVPPHSPGPVLARGSIFMDKIARIAPEKTKTSINRKETQ